jgi:hypothetical protein
MAMILAEFAKVNERLDRIEERQRGDGDEGGD